jgi:flagellar hook-basal body complex protein FliE
MAIDALVGTLPRAVADAGASAGRSRPVEPGFGDSLTRLVEAVERSNREANRAVGAMLEGEGDVHDAMIALQRADLTLQLTVQVRNKLVQAYQEIMRMPV